ncbi:MAG: hypothetical protein C0468_07160, partial [Planctomyces sp.]|nr:hypothetical protein [Planctomyces sp.]
GQSDAQQPLAPEPPRCHTLAELRAVGYRPRSVRQELRENASRWIRQTAASQRDTRSAGPAPDAQPDAPADTPAPLIPGILGYDRTVLPQVLAAMLSGHDLLLLGLRGQAKTRILRSLTHLLDEWIPVIERSERTGVELREDPLRPVTAAGRRAAQELGPGLPIEWVHRDDRYVEKLATPDVTVADLIGDLDIVRAAAGLGLSDQAALHFGLIPRANRGLFAINELPDLSPRIQVALFNVLEERDTQIRGHALRLDLDVSLVFSANPEDYTNRGRIVTPLKDRIGSVVRTHYPRSTRAAMAVTRASAFLDRAGGIGPGARGRQGAQPAPAAGPQIAATSQPPAALPSLAPPPPVPTVDIPPLLHEVIEDMIAKARKSPHINQASGVSVRASIAALENALSSAEIRAHTHGQARLTLRPCDLQGALAACRGKIELMLADDAPGPDAKPTEDRLLESLLGEAFKAVLGRALPLSLIEHAAEGFQGGVRLEIDATTSASDLLGSVSHIKGLSQAAAEACRPLGLDPKDPESAALAAEIVLELLYVNNRISKSPDGYAR